MQNQFKIGFFMITPNKYLSLLLPLILLCSISLFTYSMDIFDAAEAGDIRRVKELIDQGVDVNKPTDEMLGIDHKTPLYLAAINGHTDIVQLLIANGADINLLNEYGETTLHKAAEEGNEGAVTMLLDMGAKLNLQDCDGLTPLLAAAQWGKTAIVRILLDRGASINEKDHYGYTPLHRAVSHGNKATVKLFIARGANIYQRSHKGELPLDLAQKQDIVNLIHRVMVKAQMTTLARATHQPLSANSPAQLLQIGDLYLLPMIASYLFDDVPQPKPEQEHLPVSPTDFEDPEDYMWSF